MIPAGYFDGLRAAVFDLDDTLYAFDAPGGANAPTLRALAAFAAPRLGISEDGFLAETAASLRAQLERTGHNVGYHSRCVRFLRLVESRGLPPSLALEFTDRYWEEIFSRIAPAPGAADLLKALRARGIRVGVGTDMTAVEQFRKLRTLGLLDLFDFVVASEEAGWEKPDPRFFSLVADKAGCAPGEILFVGDSLRKDAAGAAAAGMRGLWLQPDADKRAERPDVPSAASLREIAAGMVP